LESGNVVIENSKIIAVAEHINMTTKEDDIIIDAKGLWVLPGLIDAHCHIGLIEERIGIQSEDSNEATNPITPYLRAADGINPFDDAFDNAIQAGITSVMVGPGSSNVVGGQFVFIKTYGRDIGEMTVLEPAAMKVSFGENTKKAYKKLNIAPTTRMAIASMLREELFHAVFYKKSKERASKNGEDFELNYKLEPWLAVLNKDIPLKAHVHRTDDIQTAIRIAKEFNVNITLDHCTEGHIIPKEIKDSGFSAIVGPCLAFRDKIECRNSDFKTAGVLTKEGVKVAITTDHPVSLIQHLSICAGLAVKKGLDLMEGLKAITINPAQICGVSSRVGSIEVGKDADIAIFTGNPMEISTHTVYTIINGEIVYKKENQDASC